MVPRPLVSLVLASLLLALSAVQPAAAAAPFRLAVVLSIGGLHDNGFNDAAYAGVRELRARGMRVDVYDPGDILAIGEHLRRAAGGDYDLVAAIGCLAAGDVKELAAKFPARRFAIIDSIVQAENVASYVFRDDEGARLAGCLAALVSKRKRIGFLGGMESPVIGNFRSGFEAGARSIAPGIEVLVRYVGETPDAFVDIAGGRSNGVALFGAGIDVLFTAAGLSGLGAIEAADAPGRYVIGVDSDQNGLAPARMLGSVVKRIDTALTRAVDEARAGVKPGVAELGLAERGLAIVYSPTLTKVVGKKVRKRVDAERARLERTAPPH